VYFDVRDMAGAVFYAAVDVAPTVLLLGLLALLYFVRFALPWLKKRENGGSLVEKVDWLLRNCSRFYLNSGGNGNIVRELLKEDVHSKGSSVPLEVYRSVGLYAVMVPACAFLVSLKSWFLQESFICSQNLNCFTSRGSSYFHGEDISNCSSVKTSDNVVCYKLALNCLSGLVSIGGLIVILESLMKLTSAFFQMFHKHAKVLRKTSLAICFFMCGMALVGLALGIVVSLSEVLKVATFFLCFIHALTIPWEELYTTQNDECRKDEAISGAVQNSGIAVNNDEEEVERQSSKFKDSKESLKNEEHTEDDKKLTIEVNEEISPKFEEDSSEIDGGTANKRFDTTSTANVTVQVAPDISSQDGADEVFEQEEDHSASYNEGSSSETGSLLVPEGIQGSFMSAPGMKTARKRKVKKDELRKMSSIETTV